MFPKPTNGNPNSDQVKNGNLKPWRTAAECIDWSIECPSIFTRKRPLAPATLERIAGGLKKFVFDNPDPFIVDGVAPVLTECANASNKRSMPINEPLRTICAQIKGGHHALISAFLAKNYTGVIGSDLREPIHTITAKDHHSLVTAFLTAFYGNEKDGNLVSEPLRTIPTKDRFGLVTINQVQYRIVDIGFRMLQPIELFKAQGFPDSYIFDKGVDDHGCEIRLTKTEQTRMVGNSVPPDLAYALVNANFQHEKQYEVAI